MFKKPFRIKSQVQLKSTERKKLGTEIQAAFPALSDEGIAIFSTSKEAVVRCKLYTYNDETVDVYLIDRVPMLIECLDGKLLLPTVYLCWKFPHIVPSFTTHTPVVDKLKNGADLFLPGVYLDTKEFFERNFDTYDACAVNTSANSAAVVVGQCLMSKAQACSPDSRFCGGKLVKVYHFTGDHLCKMHSMPTPHWGPPDMICDTPDIPANTNTDNPYQADPFADQEAVQVVLEGNSEILEQLTINEEQVEEEKKDPVSEKDRMNELTQYCFLKAIKKAPKTIYPILPATFFANYMLPCLPPDENLNIKKTKWKKLSEFLQEMATERVVKLETMQKNEFRLASVDTSHRIVREFVDIYNKEPVTVELKPMSNGQPSVQQVFSVTAATLPFFSKEGLKKSDELTRNDVRGIINDYIKRQSLQDETSKDRVKLDPILYQILREEIMTRGDLLQRLLDKMSVQHKVSAGEDVIVHRGKMPNIEFEVVTRSGNKKVTLISNLESYGVDIPLFAKELQQKAAASTTVNPNVPGKKGPQLQVQGNQILPAARMLDEKYGIKDRFMRGLEKAPKSRKK